MAGRGGMCALPTGVSRADGTARPRLDKLDFAAMLGPNDPREKGLLLATINDACHSYLYFGIGDESADGQPIGNGTTPDEFFWAAQYLFHVRSDRPETWNRERVVRTTAIDDSDGIRKTTVIELTDEELRFCCFDVQYAYCNFPMPFDLFVQRLRSERQDILRSNWQRVERYIGLLRTRELHTITPGHQLPFVFEEPELLQLLTDPDPVRLARLLYVPTELAPISRPVLEVAA